MGDRFRPAVLALAGDFLYRVTAGTARLEVHGAGHAEAARANGRIAIFSLWHGRLLLGARAHEGRKTAIMISRHADGEIIARIVARHGYVPVRGSTTRGGGTALRELLSLAESGITEFAFTPDGPRGPREVVQMGVIAAARLSGAPIIPVAYSCSKKNSSRRGIAS